jgi:hypothetical protein
MIFHRYFLLPQIVAEFLVITNILLINFFGKRPAPEMTIFKPNPFPNLAELENNRKSQMGTRRILKFTHAAILTMPNLNSPFERIRPARHKSRAPDIRPHTVMPSQIYLLFSIALRIYVELPVLALVIQKYLDHRYRYQRINGV